MSEAKTEKQNGGEYEPNDECDCICHDPQYCGGCDTCYNNSYCSHCSEPNKKPII